MSEEDRPVNRRSFLSRIAGGAILGGAALTVMSGGEASAITDRDPYDPVGRGRGWRRRRRYGWTGITDRDPSDRPGYGRGRRWRRRRWTDNDPDDPVGGGRGRRY